jgi:hypothetical protein
MDKKINSKPINSSSWITGGFAISLGLTLLLLLVKKWKLARFFGGLAVAFGEKWQETRAQKSLQRFMAKAAEAN